MVVGLVVLAVAADRFVVGSAQLASSWRVPPVVVGVVVVGFGTSAPELVVSVLATLDGETALAVGNITGSNLANVTLVLGAAACAGCVAIDSGTIRREIPLSTAAVCLFGAGTLSGLGTATGLVLIGALLLAAAVILRNALNVRARDEPELAAEVAELEEDGTATPTASMLRTLVGLLGTLLGAQLVVGGAVAVAEQVSLSQGFVGLTLVAVGTSLPEIVTAVQAARRGEDELIVGNVLGSNLFNSLGAGGVVALASGGYDGGAPVSGAVALMIVVAVAAGAAMAWRRRLTRIEAAALLGAYATTVPLLGAL
jgi:cation:H+ antiporter